jgi:hypothetical protein
MRQVSATAAIAAVVLGSGFGALGCGGSHQEAPLQQELKETKVHSEEANRKQKLVTAYLDLKEGDIHHEVQALEAVKGVCPEADVTEAMTKLEEVVDDRSIKTAAELEEALEGVCQ